MLPLKIQMKRCTKCQEVKPAADFYRVKNGGVGLAGLTAECKPCRALRGRAYKYKMDEKRYLEYYEAQEGKCAVCLKPLPTPPLVDHDHHTGVVRGLLCRSCNLFLGLVKENDDILNRARNYLDNSRNFPGTIVETKVETFAIENNSTGRTELRKLYGINYCKSARI